MNVRYWPEADNYMIRKIIVTIIITSVFASDAISNGEYLLFSENLDNILEFDGFSICSEYELSILKLTTAECTTRRKEANLYCSHLIKSLEPNKLTHEEWEHRMSYFYDCRTTVASGCVYKFEQTDLINMTENANSEEELKFLANRYHELLECASEKD